MMEEVRACKDGERTPSGAETQKQHLVKQEQQPL